MSKLNIIGYSLRDISIIPSVNTRIKHRSEIDVYETICERDMYPIFVAPMGTVTDEKNYKVWIDNKVTPVIPRTVGERLSLNERLELGKETFVSVSLDEAKEIINFEDGVITEKIYICIDIANGHMNELLETCWTLKQLLHDKIVIMTGNIGNPTAYKSYCLSGVDYVRLSIGTGSRCTTSANGGVHYPPATLLDKVMDEKEKMKEYYMTNKVNASEINYTKVILDGGITNFDDINKALALGADAVMIGKLFAECEEACGEIGYADSIEDFISGDYFTKDEIEELKDTWFSLNKTPYRHYYGMSTKRAQRATGGSGNKTAEGIEYPVIVKYSVVKWIDNMESYLRTAMSYCDSFNLSEYREKAEIIILGGSGDLSYRK